MSYALNWDGELNLRKLGYTNVLMELLIQDGSVKIWWESGFRKKLMLIVRIKYKRLEFDIHYLSYL